MTDKGAIVLGGHTCTGLEAVRSLGKNGISVTVVGTKSNAISYYSKFSKEYYVIPLNEKKIISFLVKIGKRKQDWVLIPTSDYFVTFLSKNYETLSKLFTVAIPPWNITQYCIDKLLTFTVAEKTGIPTPQTFCPKSKEELEKIVKQLDFKNKNWILKSRSKALFPKKPGDLLYRKKALSVEIRSKKDLLNLYLENLERTGEFLLIQEKIIGLPDKNVNVRVVMDRSSNPVVVCTDRKIRQYPLFFGVGSYRESVNRPEIAKLGLQFFNQIKYKGMAYAEFKEDPKDGKMKLIEVNPRLGMGVSLAKSCGIDLTFALYATALGIHYESPRKYETGVRWIFLRNDIITILMNHSVLPWRKTFRDIIRNIRKTKAYAYFSIEDPIPFFISLFKR